MGHTRNKRIKIIILLIIIAAMVTVPIVSAFAQAGVPGVGPSKEHYVNLPDTPDDYVEEEIEGADSYDEQDNYRDYVTITNLNEFQGFYDDTYNVVNLKVFLADYLYYFTGEDEYYTGHIDADSFENTSKYGGTIVFDVYLDEYPDMPIRCEYHKRFKLFGFDSDIGDMSLGAQFFISECGLDISSKTLKAYADGTLGQYLPMSGNKKRNPSDKVYIANTTWKGNTYNVNGWFYLDEGADESLLGNSVYSESDVQRMLIYLQNRSGGKIQFSRCLPEVWQFYEETHADIGAMLAIIMTEGNTNPGSYAAYWNFFNYKTPPGGTSIPGTSFWDAKTDCSTIGEAMVTCFYWIYGNYWLKAQDTYYTMSFNQYGYPQSAEEAKDAPKLTHCYCPWFDDTGYVRSGFDDYYAWCNKCARNRQDLMKAAGVR